MDLIVLG